MYHLSILSSKAFIRKRQACNNICESVFLFHFKQMQKLFSSTRIRNKNATTESMIVITHIFIYVIQKIFINKGQARSNICEPAFLFRFKKMQKLISSTRTRNKNESQKRSQ